MVIHRDLKPGNIMVMNNDEPKLLDFGVAATLNPETGEQQTVTIQSHRMMTPEYASPEQIREERLNAASDVYSLGVILYEMITGKRPYTLKKTTLFELVRTLDDIAVVRPSKTRDQTVTPDRIHGDLDTIVLKALALDREQRYPSVEALASDLRRYMKGLPITARPATPAYQFRRLLARNPWPFAAATGLSLFLILFAVYAHFQRIEIIRERDLANREKQTAEQVTHFLVSMFEQVDPDLARDGHVEAVEIMENGRRQMDTTLADLPEVQVRLMATMGRVYRALGRFEPSRDMLEQALAANDPDPDSWKTRIELIHTLQMDTRYIEAQQQLDLLRHELADTQDPYPLARLEHITGRQLFLRGNYVAAGKAYDRVSASEPLLTAPERLALYQDRAELLQGLAYYEQAIDVLEQLVDLTVNQYGEKHSEVARTRAMLGEQYLLLANYDKAAEHFQVSEKIYRELFGDRHYHIIHALQRNAELKRQLGEYDEAESLFRQAFDMSQDLFGKKHLSVVESMHYMAILEWARGEHSKAETLLRDALAIQISLTGEIHPDVATFLNDLGVLLWGLGKYEDTEALYRRTLDIYTASLGEKHPHVATALNNLGNLKLMRSDYVTAEPMIKRALDMNAELLGADHPYVALGSNNLASVYAARGRFNEAEPLYRKALTLRTQQLGEKHDQIARLTHIFAEMLCSQGNYSESETLFLRALATRIELFGEDHLDVARSRERLARVYILKGNPSAARPLIDKALPVFRKVLGDSHRRVALCYVIYGLIHDQSGDEVQSREYLKKGRDLAEELLPYSKTTLVFLYPWIVVDHIHRGELAEAETVVQKLSEMGETNLVQATVEHLRGRILLEKGEYTEAERLLRKALALREDSLLKAHPMVLENLVDLAICLVASGRASEALPMVTEVDDLQNLAPEHPFHEVATSVKGQVLKAMGRNQEAQPLLIKAHQALEKRFGADHYLTLQALARLSGQSSPN